MARKPAARKAPARAPRAPLPVPLILRVLAYLLCLGHFLAVRGQAYLPLGGGLTLALVVLAVFDRVRYDEESQRSNMMASMEAILMSFLLYFAGAKSGLLMVTLLLTALNSIQRGFSSGLVFALVSCLGWLGPVLTDRNLQSLTLSEVVFRVALLCLVPWVILALPRPEKLAEDLGPDQKTVALEKAQLAARSQQEVRAQRGHELYQERRKLEALMEIAHRMAVLRTPDELLATIVKCARDQLQVDVAIVLLRRGPQLVVEWKEGITETAAAKLNSPVGTGLLGRLVQSGECFAFSQAGGLESLRPYWPLQGLEQLIPAFRSQQPGYQPRSDDIKNFLVVPLKTPLDQAPAGLLMVGNRLVGDRFSQHDQGYLQILATDAAISIRNLFFLQERERSHEEMIKALAQAIEAKDPYTRGHVTRVCSYSLRLAQAMGMPASFLKDLNTAAMLHDVGKISTPDSILMKPGPLTDEEFEIMKQHVVHSARIIQDIRSVSPEIQKMVLYHHERWDGKGYPEGIQGDQIPLGAQLISVADAYDAMTSHRPYRQGMDPNEAMARLEKGAGTQFNSEILSYFMAVANYMPEKDLQLRQRVIEARQRVGANLLRTRPTSPVSTAAVDVVQESPPAAPAPVRRGPERLELDLGQ
mgnify:CR=1 FL=1